MSWIDELFGGGREQAGQDIYNIMNRGLGNYQGLFNQGVGYLSPYMNQDPAALYQQYMKNYQMSDTAKAQLAQGEKAANQANAASGMLGSGAAQKQAASMAEAVRAQDVNNYLNRLYGTRQQGLQAALGGANLMGQEGQGLSRYYQDMAQGQAGADIGQSQGYSNLFGQGLGLLGSLFGGGGFF